MAANANPGSSNVYTNYTGPNKYGAPPNNSNRLPLNRDNQILTQDYAGRALTPADPTADVVSPLTLSGNVQALQVPPNATCVTLIGSAAFNVSEFGTVGAGALTQFATIPANTPITFDCARQKFIYLDGTAAQTVSFYFQTL